MRARGRTVRRQPGVMNKQEQAYALHLEALKREGAILAWWFEGITLRLGHDCRFTPDFMVQMRDGTIELHDVKGFMEDDARVKLATCAQQFPFRVVAIMRDGTEKEFR